MTKFKLGNELKDKITGFQGVAVGHAEYLTGCDQYLLQPKCEKHGTYPDAVWFDENRLELVGESISKDDIKGDKNGCDYKAPIR